MHTPGATQQLLSEIANWKLKNIKFWCMDQGALPPVTPINPYLGANAQKNEPLFTCLFIYTHFGCLSLELNRVSGVLLEPYKGQGGQGSAELPMVLKGLMYLHRFLCHNGIHVRLKCMYPSKCISMAPSWLHLPLIRFMRDSATLQIDLAYHVQINILCKSIGQFMFPMF